MKGPLNPNLVEGDKIMCYHMEGELAVSPGTKGTVTKISKDPFEEDAQIIAVTWENGSKLPLLSSVDSWKKIPKKIDEQRGPDPIYNLFRRNPDLFRNFDYQFFRDFLLKMRDSGIVNMFGASPLIYAGKDHLERYYGEGREEDETFQELLDMADEARDKLIQGVLKYMESKNETEFDMDEINSLARKFSKDLLNLYIITF